MPTSNLLAELVNRMPAKMTLLSLEMSSKRLTTAVKRRAPKPAAGASLAGKRSKASKSAAKEEPVVTKPKFDTSLVIIGVAPTHNDVARFVAEVQVSPLLKQVELIFSEATVIRENEMNKFRIEARLRDDVDARQIVPLERPRNRMAEEDIFGEFGEE